MAPQYAKDQPAGFKNRIENVAIIGASGRIGSVIANALVAHGKHSVTAITRHESNGVLPDGIKVAKVDYNDQESLISAMKDQDFLIISLSVVVGPEVQVNLTKAAAKAGVPWVMPNCWGGDFTDEVLAKENLTGPGVLAGIKAVEDAGASSWIALACSFWYEYSLSTPRCYGFDFASKNAIFFGDGTVKINTSTWIQCGRAVSNLLCLKVLPEDEDDTSATLSHWRNKPLFTSSFTVSQRDMLDSAHRVMGTTDADWTIEYQDNTERYNKGMEILKQGDHVGFAMCLYSRMFVKDGGGDFGAKHGLANGKLGLPEESIDEATKRAIDMAMAE